MCIEGMNWGLHYIVQGLNPNILEELATCAHEMKLSKTLRDDKQFRVDEPHKVEDIEELQNGGKSAS